MRGLLLSLALLLVALTPAQGQLQEHDETGWRAWAETLSKGRFAPDPEKVMVDAPFSAWQAVRSGEVTIEKFRYPSDGLQITGFIVKPGRASGNAPVLIWARGGIGNVEQDDSQFVQMASWVQRGYVVVGSNYRGSAGSEGKDEFAGADVNDIVALLPVVKSIKGADPARLYGIGFSRGGTMLLRAAAGRINFHAIATAGAVTDLQHFTETRPAIVNAFKEMMPDYAEESANRFCKRSAICWPERIAAPVLIAQGGADESVPVEQSIRLAKAMETAKRPYRLLIIGGANHPLDGSRQLFFDEADRFFRSTVEDK